MFLFHDGFAGSLSLITSPPLLDTFISSIDLLSHPSSFFLECLEGVEPRLPFFTSFTSGVEGADLVFVLVKVGVVLSILRGFGFRLAHGGFVDFVFELDEDVDDETVAFWEGVVFLFLFR